MLLLEILIFRKGTMEYSKLQSVTIQELLIVSVSRIQRARVLRDEPRCLSYRFVDWQRCLQNIFRLWRKSLRLDLLDECIWLLPWLRNAICFEIGFVLNLSSRSKGCSVTNCCSRISVVNGTIYTRKLIRLFALFNWRWNPSVFQVILERATRCSSSIVDPFVWMIY